MKSIQQKRRKIDETPYTPIYPTLPVEESPEQQDHSYRLHQIFLLKRQLEDEREKRASLYKKYHRGINVIDGVATALVSASVGKGIGEAAFLVTIMAAPIVLALECASVACGLLGVAGKFIKRRLEIKSKKRNEIRVLAESKLNTIQDYVSAALTDGSISNQEFQLILSEIEKYSKMKDDVRTKTQKALRCSDIR